MIRFIQRVGLAKYATKLVVTLETYQCLHEVDAQVDVIAQVNGVVRGC